jgi:hypothetical protein
VIGNISRKAITRSARDRPGFRQGSHCRRRGLDSICFDFFRRSCGPCKLVISTYSVLFARAGGAAIDRICFFIPPVFKRMLALCRLRLAAPTIASHCIRVASRWASRQQRRQGVRDGHHCPVPNSTCADGNRCRGIEGYWGVAEGNGRHAVAECDRLVLRPERRRGVHSARKAVERSRPAGARSRASGGRHNMHDRHRGPCGHPRRPPRTGACRTGGRRRSITATLRQDGRIGSSSGLKTSQRSLARRCTAKLGRQNRTRISAGGVRAGFVMDDDENRQRSRNGRMESTELAASVSRYRPRWASETSGGRRSTVRW